MPLGDAVRRVEDPPLITGTSAYTDDIAPEGACHAVFVRSGLAHARIEGVATEAAAAAPGVIGVFRGEDLGLSSMPSGDGPEEMVRRVLAGDVVRFVGEPIAVVVAETRAAAADAVDLVEVEYDPLDVVVDPEAALEPGALRLFEAAEGNLAAEGEMGEAGALEDAEVVVRSRFINRRVSAAPMEPPAAAAAPDPETGGITLWVPSQAPFAARDTVAGLLGLEAEQVHVIVPAVGGGFGARISTYPEQLVVAALAHRLGRPVRYVESRWEAMIAMQHGRAQIQDVALGARRDGTLTGVEVSVIADSGAYPADATIMPWLTGRMASGVYRIPRFGTATAARSPTPRRSAPTAGPGGRRPPRCSSARWTCSPRSSRWIPPSCAGAT